MSVEENECFSCHTETPQLLECSLCREPHCVRCCTVQEPVPMCSACVSKIEHIDAFIETNQLQWATLSLRGQQWVDSCKLASFKTHYSIDVYLHMNLSSEDEDTIQKDVMSGRTDPEVFIWEIRETLQRIGHDRETIARVLKAYCAKNPSIGYCQGLNYVCTWLLMFLDENSAFWMLCYLVEKWLLPDFYIGSRRGNSLNGFYIESSVISGLMCHLMPVFQRLTLPPEEFADMFSLQLLIQLFINSVDLSATVFLWDKLMTEGSIALIKGTVSLIALSEKAIHNGEHPLRILQKLIEHRIAPQLQFMYSEVSREISEVRVERLRRQARDYRAKQWKGGEEAIVRRLEKYSLFTKEEIETLQVEFNKFLAFKRAQAGKMRSSRRRTVYLPPNIHNQIATTQGEVDIGITKTEFLEFIGELVPATVALAEAAFDQFDEDQSGYLDFRELMMSISLLSKGTFEEKLRVCFNTYDIDKTGYLQKEEVSSLLQSLLKPYVQQLAEEFDPELKQKVAYITVAVMDLVAEEKGILTFANFASTVQSNPLLHACFCEHVGTTDIKISQFATVIRSASSNSLDRGTGGCIGCYLM